jgi:hypothetical protein
MIMLAHFDLVGADLAAFEAYEDAVLPLLADHGADLLRRFRSLDNALEVHGLYFPSSEARQAYLADPRRAAHAPMWRISRVSATLIEVDDLPTAG